MFESIKATFSPDPRWGTYYCHPIVPELEIMSIHVKTEERTK